MDSDELYEFFELVLKQLLAAVPNLCQKVKDERYADNLLVSLQRLNTVLAKIHIWLGSSARVGSATTRRMKKMLNDLETMCSWQPTKRGPRPCEDSAIQWFTLSCLVHSLQPLESYALEPSKSFALDTHALEPWEVEPSIRAVMSDSKASKQLLTNLERFEGLLSAPKSSYEVPSYEVPSPVLPEDDPSQASSSLHQAIRQLINCNCKVPELPKSAGRAHRGCLQLSRATADAKANVHLFDASFTIAPAHYNGSAALWRHTRIQIPKRAVKVAFEVDVACESSGHRGEQQQSRPADVRLLTDLCDLLGNDFGPNRFILVVNDNQLFDTHNQDFPGSNVLPADALTLEEALMTLTPTGDARLLLVKILAQSFWQFYGTDWMCARWTSGVIQFLPQSAGFPRRDSSSASSPIYNPLKPFVDMIFEETQAKDISLKHDHLQGRYTPVHRAPQILALGVILTKILDHERPVNSQTQDVTQIKRLNEECLSHQERIADPRWPAINVRNKFVCTVLRKAVSACLNASNFGHSPVSTDDRRQWLFDNVVWPLTYIVDLCEPKEEEAGFILQAQMQADSRINQDVTTTEPAMCESLPTSSTPTLEDSVSATYLNTTSDRDLRNSLEWFSVLQTEVHPNLIPDVTVASGVKIAIIDTGANFNKSQYKGFHRQHISGCRTWCDAKTIPSGRSFMDAGGNIMKKDRASDPHGTYSLSALRKVAPNCIIFVAQVFQGRDDIKNRYPSEDQAQRIANAIDYAATEEQADIISMSFGFKDEVPVIRTAINQAADRALKPCLLFAAASNYAGNEDVQWPASHDRVICVHAADGIGNKYSLNVGQKHPWKEFATLGCGVEAFIGPGQQAIKNGTSVASPVAAGLAALILGEVHTKRAEYLRWIQGDLKKQGGDYDEMLYRLRTCGGMSRVLMKMSTFRDGYNYIRPVKLLHNNYRHECLRVHAILDAVADGEPVHI